MTPEERSQKKIIIGGIWIMLAVVLMGILVLLIPWRCILPWMCEPPKDGGKFIPRPLTVDWVTPVPRADGAWDFVGAITNPNSTHGVRRLDYSFKVFDAAGVSLRELKGITYIIPNDEERFVAELNHRFLSQPVRAELILGQQPQWEELKGFSGPNLRTVADSVSGTARQDTVRVNTTVINNSGIVFDKVDVVAVALSQANDVVGVGLSNVGSLNPDEPRDAFIDIVTRPGVHVSRVRTGSYTNVFLNENLLRRYRGNQSYESF